MEARRGQRACGGRLRRRGAAGWRAAAQILSPFHPVRSRRPGLLRGVLLAASLAIAARGQAVRLEFASPEADARTYQALRLTLDLPGPPRAVVVRLVLPPGAETVRPIDRVDVGGGLPRTYLFNVSVPDRAAGDFVVTGEVRDDARVWPLRAALRIRPAPKVRVAEQPAESVVVASDAVATNRFTVANTGNTPLDLGLALQPNPGVRTAVTPDQLTLAPGESGTVEVTARADGNVRTLFETSVFTTVEARRGDFVQRDTVGFGVCFVPVSPSPGPLFAQLTGEIIPGWLLHDNGGAGTGFAGRFALSGLVTPHTRLEMSGADGRESVAGSRTGLADRDYARVALQGPWGQAAGGLVSPPSFGFLEPSTDGRGGLAERVRGDWTLAAFATRDTYPGFARQHLGLQARQPDGRWEFGALAQTNESTGTPETRRYGGYAQLHWARGRLDSSTQVAAVDIDNDALGVRWGGEQRLGWDSEHLDVYGTLQMAQDGFDLAGRSSRESNGTLTWRQDPWQWYVRGLQSYDDGELATTLQRRRDFGQFTLQPQLVELSTRDTSERREWTIGVDRQASIGRLGVSASRTEYRTALDLLSSYREDSGDASWSRSSSGTYADLTLTGGRERTLAQDVDFAEIEGNLSGQLVAAFTYSLTARQVWNWNGFSNGLRRPGFYGQVSLNWQRHPTGWRLEAGADAYEYEGLPGVFHGYAVVELPVSRWFRLGFEGNIETNGGPANAWVFLRMPLGLPVPWRPTHGALVGRVTDGHGAGLPGALADLGGRRAITTADGRFVLPAMAPGKYPLTWRLPGGWAEGEDWPREVTLHAGDKEEIALGAQPLALLQGSVVILSDAARGGARGPDGAVRAVSAAGRIFEARVVAGDFQIGLPPGSYELHFEGQESVFILEQLQGRVVISPGTRDITFELRAVEVQRPMRQTLFPDKGS